MKAILGSSQHRVARHRGSGDLSARPNRAHRPPLGSHERPPVVPRARTNPAHAVRHIAPRRRACQGRRAGGAGGQASVSRWAAVVAKAAGMACVSIPCPATRQEDFSEAD